MTAMRPLVIIPTYNEAENIERMVHRIADSLPAAGILVVDDGSPDGTGDLVKAARRPNCPYVHLLTRSGKAGLGSAYRAGFAWGLQRDYDALVEMDADFSHDPAALPDIVAPLSEGFDLSIGSRYVKGGAIPNWARHRHLLSSGGNRYASVVLGLHVADSTAGFRAYSAGIIRKLDLNAIRAEGYGFQIEMTYRAKQHGAAIVEVPITFVDRAAGESKMSSRIVLEALALVTWWGMGRAVRGLRQEGRQLSHAASSGRASDSRASGGPVSSGAVSSGAVSGSRASGSRAGSNDPVRSA